MIFEHYRVNVICQHFAWNFQNADFYIVLTVEAFTLALTGSNVIEMEQDKSFSIEIFCQTVDGEEANGKQLLEVIFWLMKN